MNNLTLEEIIRKLDEELTHLKTQTLTWTSQNQTGKYSIFVLWTY